MKIAIAQLNPTIGDFANNIQKIVAAASQAAKNGVDLLLTPELSLCGYPPRDLLLNPNFVLESATQLQRLTEQLPDKLAVLVGLATLNPKASAKGQKPLFNSLALLKNHKFDIVYHKQLLPSYDVFDENRYFESGARSEVVILQTAKGQFRIGLSICEDLWNDEGFWGKRHYAVNPLADLQKLGVDLVVNLSASPYSVGKQKLRERMLRHSAQHHQLPLIYANQIGGNDDLIFDGGSIAINAKGEVVCRAQSFAADFVTVEFDPTPNDLLPGSIVPLPATEAEEIWLALVLGLQDYVRKCGFEKVVLGLSGGIDSALVAAIAAAALGPDKVLAVLMPSPYTRESSLTDACQLVNNLGLQRQKLPIVPAMEAYQQILEPMFAGAEPGIAEENIQARIRGNLLMAIANKFGHLVISTGNKSEMSVGYSTLYGDMSGGLAAIADLPKTKVYEVCRWLNRNGEIIPQSILDKAPSAELKPDQTDQDSLPPYEVLDDILARLLQDHQTKQEIVAAGHDPQTVDRVLKMVFRAEFKRRQAPPGLKVTDRAFGSGWRMPIASRWLT